MNIIGYVWCSQGFVKNIMPGYVQCSQGYVKNIMGYDWCSQGYVENIMKYVQCSQGMLRILWGMVGTPYVECSHVVCLVFLGEC